MLCPADMDPFSGPYYRVCATIHQGILCPLACKLVCYYFATSVNDKKTELVHIKPRKDNTVNGYSDFSKKLE